MSELLEQAGSPSRERRGYGGRKNGGRPGKEKRGNMNVRAVGLGPDAGGEEENGEEGPVGPVGNSASSLRAQPMGRQKKDSDRVTLKI